MSIKEVSPEQFAESFQHYYQTLSRDFGCAGQPCRKQWEDLTPDEKNCLTAASRLALMEFSAERQPEPSTDFDSRRYFAKPGEAEWGC